MHDRQGQGTALNGPARILGGAATCQEMATESTPARNQISGAEQWLSDLYTAVDRLEQRLDTILTPAPPQIDRASAATGSVPTPLKSHVVGRLEQLNVGCGLIAERLHQLTTRVEL